VRATALGTSAVKLLDGEAAFARKRRRDLAHMLRVRRESLSLADVGLPRQWHRLAQSLHREEVAYLAGIDPALYVQLETAQEVAPSSETLLAISRSLKFSIVETEYLFELAGLGIPKRRDASEATIPEALEQMVPDLRNVGAVFFDRYLTALRWNSIADVLLMLSKSIGSNERNAVKRLMADPRLKASSGIDVERLAGEIVSMFRRAYLASEPTPFARQIHEELMSHPLLARYWDDELFGEDVFEGGKGPFERDHPTLGRYAILTTNLIVSRPQGTILRIIAPADGASAEKFARFAELGSPSSSEAVVYQSPNEAS
jgi:transcriptional regulator with XRE-family HTH domain